MPAATKTTTPRPARSDPEPPTGPSFTREELEALLLGAVNRDPVVGYGNPAGETAVAKLREALSN